jgi:hypothetical protein
MSTNVVLIDASMVTCVIKMGVNPRNLSPAIYFRISSAELHRSAP